MTTLAETVTALRGARDRWRARQEEGRDVESFPSREAIAVIVDILAAALYPRRLGRFRGAAGDEEDRFVAAKLIAGFGALEREIAAELGYWQKESRADFPADQAASIVRLFGASLGEVRELVDGDVEAAFLGDPAARSVDEILLCYPGAIARHPVVEDDVVIYAGATILGRVSIGARSVIGGNVWLLSDVPADSVIVQPEARELPAGAARALKDELEAA